MQSSCTVSSRSGAVIGLLLAATGMMAGCQDETKRQVAPPTLVDVAVVAYVEVAPTFSLTGVIRPRTESALSFRTAGRMTQRNAEPGSHVEAGQLLATVDATEQEATLRAAEATVLAARAVLSQAQAAFDRQKSLLAQGFTTRRQYDAAEEALMTATQSVTGADAQLGTARDALTFAELRAPHDGVITTRSGEVGQVVQAAQTVFTLAADGPRDAVFYVNESVLSGQPPDPRVGIALVSDPSVTAIGMVREISPTVDQGTGTVQTKIALEETPAAMTLGSTVTGRATMRPEKAIILPWSALFSQDGLPAVWVVDAASKTVSLKPIAVARFDTGRVVVSGGLDEGEMVVTAGGKLLHPDQVVAIAEEAGK